MPQLPEGKTLAVSIRARAAGVPEAREKTAWDMTDTVMFPTQLRVETNHPARARARPERRLTAFCTVADVDYQLGSEGLDWFGLPPAGIGADRRTRRQMPGGLCHAVPRTGTVAVCGIDLALRLWADRPWELGAFPRCERCQELVPLPEE